MLLILFGQLENMMEDQQMNCNVGGMDMATRLIVGAVLLVVAFTVPMSTLWQTVVLVLATIGLVTGAIRFCPLNALLGLNSCSQKREKSQGRA